MNLNKVFLIGNLTRDPELKTLPSGTAVASFGIATNRVWKNDKGEKKEDTQFHNVVAFGRQAEILNQYMKKGSMIFVEGRIQTRSWDAQDGSKRYATEIVAETFQFGPKTGGFKSENGGVNQEIRNSKNGEMPVIDLNSEDIKSEDLPF